LPTAVKVLAESTVSGLALVEDRQHRIHGMFNHPEYDTGTLRREYLRDLEAKQQISMPKHYFPRDDTTQEPQNSWSKDARCFFANWLDLVATAHSTQQAQQAA